MKEKVTMSGEGESAPQEGCYQRAFLKEEFSSIHPALGKEQMVKKYGWVVRKNSYIFSTGPTDQISLKKTGLWLKMGTGRFLSQPPLEKRLRKDLWRR